MLDLSLVPAAELNEDQKESILAKFFWAHPDSVIGQYPRYRQLWSSTGPTRRCGSRTTGTSRSSPISRGSIRWWSRWPRCGPRDAVSPRRTSNRWSPGRARRWRRSCRAGGPFPTASS
jgi:hypothetical protein